MIKSHLTALCTACAVVFLASFPTWFEIRTTFDVSAAFPQLSDMPPELQQAMQQAMAKDMQRLMTANGWSGHVTLLGLKLPNWLVPSGAAILLLVMLLGASGAWDPPRGLARTIAGFCVLHQGVLFIAVGLNQDSVRFGPGAFLSGLGCAGMLIMTIWAKDEVYEWGAASHEPAFGPQGDPYGPGPGPGPGPAHPPAYGPDLRAPVGKVQPFMD